MESAYQRNAKTGRKAAGEMKLKTIFAHREGHLSTDIEKEILRIFPQTIPRPQSGRKGILRKYTQYRYWENRGEQIRLIIGTY